MSTRDREGSKSPFHREDWDAKGFAIVPEIFTSKEVAAICRLIESGTGRDEAFRRSADLFAIRGFLQEIPEARPLIFNDALRGLLTQIFPDLPFLVKSIYFDKPPGSNWFVPLHQDLSINVSRRVELPGFVNWTIKGGSFGVQPPLEIQESIATIRIHLDDTDEGNGALRVLPGTHRNGVQRSPGAGGGIDEPVACEVRAGGVMLMRPLLMHASGRSAAGRRRRVIHLEFSDRELPVGLQWAERQRWR